MAHEQDTDAHGALVWIGTTRRRRVRWRRDFRDARARAASGASTSSTAPRSCRWSASGSGRARWRAPRRRSRRPGVPLVALRVTPTALILRVAGRRARDAVRALHAAFLED